MKIEERVPLAPRTTLGVGGPARIWLEATDEDDIDRALEIASERDLPLEVIGAGSNLLVADRGLDAVVLRVKMLDSTIALGGPIVRVAAGAGIPWDALVRSTVERGWAGLECLSGIPGDVGATPIQNVGAYGQEVAETIVEVRAVRRATGKKIALDRAALGFGYRDSIFKREARGEYVLTRVTFDLVAGGAPKVAYAELAKRLEGKEAPSLAATRAAVLELRRAKSMVLDPDDANGKSAGSFFMNPILAREAADRVDGGPKFDAGDDKVKLSAGWLIEHAGMSKGFGDGRAGLSTRHALAVVNRGGATAKEIVDFACDVRKRVFDRFGIELRPEPVLLGFEPREIEGLVGPLR